MALQTLTGPEIAPDSGTVKRLVIFLHGLGSNGDDLISLADMFALPDTQYISPNAPFAFDMAPFGYQWFSLTSYNPASMLAGIKIAAPILDHFIDTQRERFGLNDADIALVGFSQGTMMSLYTAIRREKPIAGIVGFSGALLGAEFHDAEISSRPPICLVHGVMDAVVPFAAMDMAETSLRAHGLTVESHARPMLGHSIDPEGIDAANVFLKKCFGLS